MIKSKPISVEPQTHKKVRLLAEKYGTPGTMAVHIAVMLMYSKILEEVEPDTTGYKFL